MGRPYIRQLDEMTAFRPSSAILDLQVAPFRRSQSFEVEARRSGAWRETLGVIAAARSAVGTDDLR